MAFSFLKLPRELKDEIVSHVPDQPSRYNLLRCSRAMYQLVLPHLYRHVKLTECHVSIYKFTCQILEYHDRARLVRSLIFHPYHCQFSLPGLRRIARCNCTHCNCTRGNCTHRNCTQPAVLITEVHESIQRAIRRARDSERHENCWLEDIMYKDSIDGLLAVLLPYLPRLEYLELTLIPIYEYCNSMLTNVQRHGSGKYPETAFEQLRHVVAPQVGESDLTFSGISHYQLAHLMRMPTLKSIVGNLNTNSREEFAFMDRREDGSSSVRSLRLEGSWLNRKIMRQTVTACQELRSLELKLRENDAFPRVQWDPSYFADLIAAVGPASQRLETLSLTYTHGYVMERWQRPLADSESDRRSRVRLAEFPSLRHVTLSMMFIFGPDIVFTHLWSSQPPPKGNDKMLLPCLPPTIETLHLVQCHAEYFLPIWANVEALLWQKKEGLFEKLSLVIVEDGSPVFHRPVRASGALLGTYESEDSALELAKLASSVGVEFRIVSERHKVFQGGNGRLR